MTNEQKQNPPCRRQLEGSPNFANIKRLVYISISPCDMMSELWPEVTSSGSVQWKQARMGNWRFLNSGHTISSVSLAKSTTNTCKYHNRRWTRVNVSEWVTKLFNNCHSQNIYTNHQRITQGDTVLEIVSVLRLPCWKLSSSIWDWNFFNGFLESTLSPCFGINFTICSAFMVTNIVYYFRNRYIS